MPTLKGPKVDITRTRCARLGPFYPQRPRADSFRRRVPLRHHGLYKLAFVWTARRHCVSRDPGIDVRMDVLRVGRALSRGFTRGPICSSRGCRQRNIGAFGASAYGYEGAVGTSIQATFHPKAYDYAAICQAGLVARADQGSCDVRSV